MIAYGIPSLQVLLETIFGILPSGIRAKFPYHFTCFLSAIFKVGSVYICFEFCFRHSLPVLNTSFMLLLSLFGDLQTILMTSTGNTMLVKYGVKNGYFDFKL